MTAPSAQAPELWMWVLYDHPTDFPDVYVARRFVIGLGTVTPTSETLSSGEIEGVRRVLRDGYGLTCIKRQPADDPKIVEVWL